MPRRRIALTSFALCAGISALGGCSSLGPSNAAMKALAASEAGPEPGTPSGDGYAYSGGRAVKTFGSAPAVVTPAVFEAMTDLKVVGLHKTVDGGVTAIEGTTADRRRASVAVRPQQGSSRVVVRFGLFGDEPLSRALMDRIGVRLGDLPPAAIPDTPPSSPSPNPFISLKRTVTPDSEMLKEMADSRYRDSPVP